MSVLRAGMAEIDITPRIHPEFGAWGTTPNMTEIDLPLKSVCLALEQDGETVLWYGTDLVGEPIAGTNAIRDQLADALELRREQIIWSTSQTHSPGAIPGSVLTGCSICEVGCGDPEFAAEELDALMNRYVSVAKQALESLRPANVWAGRGFCDNISYNRRFPMPNGGVKFSRHHSEALQSGKFFDTTVGLVRFEDLQGRPIGAIFNFGAHPATMINGKWLSPDWVGTARQVIEDSIGGAPAMFVQGFCGDVNCYHIFGTPEQARENGLKLGKAAAEAMPTLIPARGTPLRLAYRTIDIECRPMYTREELEKGIEGRLAFQRELDTDPKAVWVCGINVPEYMNVQDKKAIVDVGLKYLYEGLRILDAGEPVRSSLQFTLGALRIGDVAAVISHGENFTATGRDVRNRSPFVHTLICGDTNGMFGYLADDAEIDRGGYGADSYWKLLYINGFRLAPAKGSADRIISASGELLRSVL